MPEGNDGTKLILKARKEDASTALKKHIREIGERHVFVDNVNFPQGKMYVMTRAVRDIRSPGEHIEPHKHNVDSLMMFVGDDDDLKGLTVEVQLGGDWFNLDSPGSVYVPAGREHNIRFVQGSGKYINIVLVQGGNYNSVTT